MDTGNHFVYQPTTTESVNDYGGSLCTERPVCEKIAIFDAHGHTVVRNP